MGKKTSTRNSDAWERPQDSVDTVLLGTSRVARCRARLQNRKTLLRCSAPAMRGKAVCRRHGGESTGAPLKHGRYSQLLGPLTRAYESFEQVSDLQDARPGLAAMDAWIAYQFELVSRGDGLEFRQQAVALFTAVELAIAAGDVEQLKGALVGVREHFKAGADQLRTIDRAMLAVSRRQHHTERAREIDLRGEQVITAKALLAFLARIVDAIRQELPKDADRVLRRLTDEVLAARGGVGLPAGVTDSIGDAVRGVPEPPH